MFGSKAADAGDASAGSVAGQKRSATAALILQDDDEEEEDDEEIVPQHLIQAQQQALAPPAKEQSVVYMDALRAIETDPWNTSSWLVTIDEARAGRSGSTTLLEACEQFLKQFPKSAEVWQLYCETLVAQGDLKKAKESYDKTKKKCRSVPLWLSYIHWMKRTTVDVAGRDTYLEERKRLEDEFEFALDHVGHAVDSHTLWRAYVDFVRSWPENSAMDSGLKLTALRNIYKRVICTPNLGLDDFWKEYMHLERSTAEQYKDKDRAEVENTLMQMNDKYSNAKLLLRDKNRLLQRVDGRLLARLPAAVAPTVHELDQLDAWNKYIALEKDQLSAIVDNSASPAAGAEAHRSLMVMTFERCLCHLRFFPEVWIAYANYIRSVTAPAAAAPMATEGATPASTAATTAAINAIKAIYREAITTIPHCAMLRLSWAEALEEYGSVDSARVLLKQAYEVTPSPLSFAALQRHVRKKDGKLAGRKCFSETLPLRNDGRLGVEVYLAHAEMELNMNFDAVAALNVLKLAQKRFAAGGAGTALPGAVGSTGITATATATSASASSSGSNESSPAAVVGAFIECDLHYVRLLSRVLLQLGDVEQLRYAFCMAFDALMLSATSSSTAGVAAGGPDTAAASATPGAAGKDSSGSGSAVVVLTSGNLPTVVTSATTAITVAGAVNCSVAFNSEWFMRTQWFLWEELYVLENTFGCNNILRLNRIRDSRNLARSAYIERFGVLDASGHGGGHSSSSSSASAPSSVPANFLGANIRYVGYNVSQADLYMADKTFSMFSATVALFERYDNFSFPLLPPPAAGAGAGAGAAVGAVGAVGEANGEGLAASATAMDFSLKQRSRGLDRLAASLRKKEEDRLMLLNGGGNAMDGMGRGDGRGRRAGRRGQDHDEIDEMLGIPPLLREFITKLPSSGGAASAAPNHAGRVDDFVDHLRRCVLPPRPYSDVDGGGGHHQPPQPPQPPPPHSSGLLGLSAGGMDMEDDEDEDDAGAGTGGAASGVLMAGSASASASSLGTAAAEGSSDIFLQRQRRQLMNSVQ